MDSCPTWSKNLCRYLFSAQANIFLFFFVAHVSIWPPPPTLSVPNIIKKCQKYFSNQRFFSNFSCMFLNPNNFSNLNSNCSNLLDLRNLQEQVKKAFCYQKLFWPFTVWINCSKFLQILGLQPRISKVFLYH